MMGMTEKSDPPKKTGQIIFRILSGYEIAVACLVLLFLLTFFGTIEQKWIGLYQAIERYFDIGSFFVVPQRGDGKVIFLPLPGAYWVMVVLFVNMTLGGLIRAKKGIKKLGVLISHFSILFMLAAGAVSSVAKEEGLMFVFEGQKADFAQSYHEPTLEIFEYREDGKRGRPYVVDSEDLLSLDQGGSLTVQAGEFPFKARVENFMRSSRLTKSAEGIDGYQLLRQERNVEEELNMAGAHLILLTEGGQELQKLILSVESPFPVSATVEGKRYGFLLTKKVWPMPYTVELHRSIGEYYPGTQKPSWFQSDVTKVDNDGGRESYEIVMNDPMRHGGYTLFQARWNPPAPGQSPSSGFAIVKNPSDQWPKYALVASILGLGFHFILMLFRFGGRGLKTSKQTTENPATA